MVGDEYMLSGPVKLVKECRWIIEQVEIGVHVSDPFHVRRPFEYEPGQKRRQGPAVFTDGPISLHPLEFLGFDGAQWQQGNVRKIELEEMVLHRLVHAQDP